MPLYFPFLVLVLPFLAGAIVCSLPNAKKNDPKEIHKKIRILCFILLPFAFFLAYSSDVQTIRTKNTSFNGVIEKAYYEKPKEIPHITIKGVEYDLGGLNYPDYDTIVAGDIAIKEKGTFVFKLIKKGRR
jgi:hypothetical protein